MKAKVKKVKIKLTIREVQIFLNEVVQISKETEFLRPENSTIKALYLELQNCI